MCVNTSFNREIGATLVGAAIIAVMGVVDDCKDLNAKLKFAIQIIAALIVIYGGDVKITVFTNPNLLSPDPYLVLPEWASVILAVIWIVFITSAVNFIDGLDRLAAGVSAIMSVSLVFISMRTGSQLLRFPGRA
jgi:UDP-GlcNAc:undecaprenyl-phosphate GlcNAc-1-phosphate transferase